jgi:hypothetical protein
MKTKRNRIFFAFLIFTLMLAGGIKLSRLSKPVMAMQAPPEMVCYSVTNKQGWTGINSGIPPALDQAVGNTFTQYRFELSCTRVGGKCKPFGQGSRIFLDHDGPNGPLASYEQIQFYSDAVQPEDLPQFTTTADSEFTLTKFTFKLTYGTTDETLSGQFELLWSGPQNGPLPGNAPTLDELNRAFSGSWFGLNHAVLDNPIPAACLNGGIRASAPAGPVWVNGVQRCGTFSGIASPCCVGTLSDATSSGLVADVFEFAPISCSPPTPTPTPTPTPSPTPTPNTPPTISTLTVIRTAGAAGTTSQIATVNDAQDPEDTLFVTVNGGAGAVVNGVNVVGLSVNAAGQVTAGIVADCTATNASFTLRVTDQGGAFAQATLNVTVTPNPVPTLGTYPNTTIVAGSSTTITPANPPADDRIINSVTVTTPGFTGTATVNATTGVVSIGSASPAGSFTVSVGATDNCGAQTTRTFTLTVTCPTVVLSPTALPNGVVNTAYSASVTAAPAGGNYTFARTSGILPPGVTLNSNGSLSGTPTLSGTFNFRITATGFGSCPGFRDYTLIVTCTTITLDPASLPAAAVRQRKPAHSLQPSLPPAPAVVRAAKPSQSPSLADVRRSRCQPYLQAASVSITVNQQPPVQAAFTDTP